MVKKFIRRTFNRYSKLGLRRKKKQIWRRPTGRDNKMREKRRGYPAIVSIGYRTEKKDRDLIDGKEQIIINNIKDLEKVGKEQIAVLGKVGKKKKLEIAKKAKSKGIEIFNLNVKQTLRKAERKNKKPKTEEKPAKAKEDKK
jgi:large subunit ribosomal protein L32e